MFKPSFESKFFNPEFNAFREPEYVQGELVGTIQKRVCDEILKQCQITDSYVMSRISADEEQFVRLGGNKGSLFHVTNWEESEDNTAKVIINISLLMTAIYKGYTDMCSIMDYAEGI